jgi:hypothetical protein
MISSTCALPMGLLAAVVILVVLLFCAGSPLSGCDKTDCQARKSMANKRSPVEMSTCQFRDHRYGQRADVRQR